MGYARQPGVFGLERARIQHKGVSSTAREDGRERPDVLRGLCEIKDAGRFDKDIALNGPL
jgi:hypothetical protein